MHQLKHIVENRGANTAEMPWRGSPSGVVETGWSGKNKRRRKYRESEKKAEDCTPTWLHKTESRWDMRVVPLCSYFPSCRLWYPSRLQAFWIRDCNTLYYALSFSAQIITQQKLMYTWQCWKSDPFETQGKLEITEFNYEDNKVRVV